MEKRCFSLLLAAALCLGLPSCSSTNLSSTTKSTGNGMLIGGVAGLALGNPVIGAVAGGALGAMHGQRKAKKAGEGDYPPEGYDFGQSQQQGGNYDPGYGNYGTPSGGYQPQPPYCGQEPQQGTGYPTPTPAPYGSQPYTPPQPPNYPY